MNVTSLPSDILLLILETLTVLELSALSQTCRTFHVLITDFGWTSYSRSHPRPSASLSAARSSWSPVARVKYDYLADQAWQHTEFIARPLSTKWDGKEQPILALSPSRLIVAAGSTLYSYAFGKIAGDLPSISLEATLPLRGPNEHRRNITAATFLEDGGRDETLLIAFQDHAVERIRLIPVLSAGHPTLSITRTLLDAYPKADYIESFSVQGDIMLSLSANGIARLSSPSPEDPNSFYSRIDLSERSWVSHMCLNASTPFVAFGTSSNTPLAVHSITQNQLSETPFAILHTERAINLSPDRLSSSAVYGLSSGPLSSPWGSSPQIIVSGWFDGQVRIYDLRSSSRASIEPHSRGPSLLKPVLSFRDRWSNEPIYSVSCGGGSSSHIAAGTARHSVVSFWDVRSPREGWSVHAPSNDRSPVYSVILESSRFFGATESRPFLYDFGPGATPETYPALPATRGTDNTKQKKLTYRVLQYTHTSSGLCNEH